MRFVLGRVQLDRVVFRYLCFHLPLLLPFTIFAVSWCIFRQEWLSREKQLAIDILM